MAVIGIDVGGTTLKLGVVENKEDIVLRITKPSVHDAKRLAETLCEMINEAREKYPNAPVAISIPGIVDENNLLTANQFGFKNEPVGDMINSILGEEVKIENDGVCALYAEKAAGALKDVTSGVMITLGTGIGGGILVNGKPYAGKKGVHAELGHIITHADGLQCSCGQYGCWEAYGAASCLTRMAHGMEPKQVVEKVRAGEMTAVWKRYLHELSIGFISLCSLFSPEVIAIGGGLSGAGDLLVNGLLEDIKYSYGLVDYTQNTEIRIAKFGNDAGIIGAAALAEEK